MIGLVLGPAVGCGPDLLYLPSLAIGQTGIVFRSVPIEDALRDDSLPDDIHAKLELIQDARRYAVEVMGLHPGASFESFYDNTNGTRTYNVSASRKDRFEALTWSFPFVGTFPYLGFFDRERAERQMDAMRDDGYDVLMYEVDAYSTLALLPNPVQATMLRRDAVTLVDTVIHEIAHSTVWRRDDVTFNESLATFVARTGVVEYYLRRRPDQPEIAAQAIARAEDTDRYNAFVFDLYAELESFYASDLSSAGKIAGRESVFAAARERFVSEIQPTMNRPEAYSWVANLPTNNAWMLANYRYNLDLDLFARVHLANGNEWSASIAVFTAAAAAPDAKAYLRDWLEDNADES